MDDKEELKICALWRLDPISPSPWWTTASSGSTAVLEPGRQDVLLADTSRARSGSTTTTSRPGRPPTSRLFASFKNDNWRRRRLTVDAEGCVWNAQLISGELVRYAPDGSVERRIGMPVRNITSVVFRRGKLDEIYVTSMARVKHPRCTVASRKKRAAVLAGSSSASRAWASAAFPSPLRGLSPGESMEKRKPKARHPTSSWT